MEGGGTLREQISDHDDVTRTYENEITESPNGARPPPGADAWTRSTGGSRVTWVTEITPDDTALAMAPVFEEGMQSLKARLERD